MNNEHDIDGPLLRTLLVVSFGSLLLNLSSATIGVALDRLIVELRAPLATVQWVVTGYLLALTLVLPSFRWAVERLGSRRLYVSCLLGFGVTSALCACAWSIGSLIAFRVLQGAVGGLLAPLAQAIIAQLAGPSRMGRAVSIVAIPVLVAPVLGPLFGGVLVEKLSWRWLFLFNVPLAALGAWVAQRRLPEGKSSVRTRLDLRGLVLLSPGVALFTYGVTMLVHGGFGPRTYGPLLVALALVVAFVADARRRPLTALLDLRLFEHRVVGAALATYLLASFASFGAQLVLPLYFQQVRGASPMSAGLLLAPQGLGMLLTLPQVGKLADRFDPGRIVICGVLVTIAGTYAFTQVTADTSYVVLAVSLFVRGAGLGATSTPALAAAYKTLSRDEIPNATTALNVVQRLGAPLGTAAMAVTLARFGAHAVGGGTSALAHAFAHTFTVSAAISAVGLLAALGLVRSSKGTPP